MADGRGVKIFYKYKRFIFNHLKMNRLYLAFIRLQPCDPLSAVFSITVEHAAEAAEDAAFFLAFVSSVLEDTGGQPAYRE